MNRREALPLMGVGLGGLALMTGGCVEPRYEVEATRVVSASPTTEIQRHQVTYYERQSQLGERITDRSTVEPRLMYVNPVLARERLDPNMVIYRDFSVVRRVTSGSGYGTVAGDVAFPNRQIVLMLEDATRQFEPGSFNVLIANSRGNTSIGRNRVSSIIEMRAETVFHPDQLNVADRDRRVLVFDVEVDGHFLRRATEEGENVLRVLNNDHQIIVEQKNPESGSFDKRDVYQVKAPK